MKRLGQLLFLGALAIALTLYCLTMPKGLPWNSSTHLALAHLGFLVRLPEMPHPFWGFHVQVFGGSIPLAIFMAALAAGLLAAIVNRYFGWRFAMSAALTWTFLPGVWNRAVCGQRSVVLAALIVVAAWVLNAVLLWATRRARKTVKAEVGKGRDQTLSGVSRQTKRVKLNRIAGWVALGASVLFALVSLSRHDYLLGEPASVFARGVVEAAGARTIVLNGVCDDQIVVLATNGESRATIALRNDETYRTNLVDWVKATFPTETNLWIAAQVSPLAFLESATKRHPDCFYLMNGPSSTSEQWERRWKAFEPYLGSRDPFVAVGRRMFGYEGNAIANACSNATAYAIYTRIYEEIDPKNFSALANRSEMIRRGHAVSGEEKKRVQEKIDAFFSDAHNRKHVREIVRAAGPIRSDPAFVEKMAEEAKKRIAAKIAAGEKIEVAPEVLSLVEWNNEMVALMDRGEIVGAGRLARAILSNPKWRGFLPANAVMGSVAAHDGDYIASEAFFRVATDTTNAVAAVVLNDYADTLVHLGKLAEAEVQARRAVKVSDETFWLARLTLAEILVKKGENGKRSEIKTLLQSVLRHAPPKAQKTIRKETRDFLK